MAETESATTVAKSEAFEVWVGTWTDVGELARELETLARQFSDTQSAGTSESFRSTPAVAARQVERDGTVKVVRGALSAVEATFQNTKIDSISLRVGHVSRGGPHTLKTFLRHAYGFEEDDPESSEGDEFAFAGVFLSREDGAEIHVQSSNAYWVGAAIDSLTRKVRAKVPRWRWMRASPLMIGVSLAIGYISAFLAFQPSIESTALLAITYAITGTSVGLLIVLASYFFLPGFTLGGDHVGRWLGIAGLLVAELAGSVVANVLTR